LQAPCPTRTGRPELVDARESEGLESEAVAGPPARQRIGGAGFIERRQRQSVASRDRQEGRDAGARPEERGDPECSGLVQGEGTAEKGTPRKEDRQLIRDADEFSRRPFRGSHYEEGIRQPTTGRPPRRTARDLGHRGGIRIDSDDEGVGLRPRPGHDRPTVAGTEVDDDPARSGDPLSELADVHLGQASADHGPHSRNLHFIGEGGRLVSQGAAARVGIVVGSRSDIAAAERASAVLDELGVPSEIRVISAHRAPDLLTSFASSAEERGIRVFIAIAGLAAHLPGVLASQTTAPVIGVPMAGGVADGLDALLAIVQMPKGVPVATVGVGNGENAALLAAQMLALSDPELSSRLAERRRAQAEAIADDVANAGL
jgi:5-(carboxyamino)imidazole ribonucleotide mutase